MPLLKYLASFAFAAVTVFSVWAHADTEKSPEVLSPQRVAELTKQLGANSFKERQQASTQLLLAGRSAIPALEKAAVGTDREVTTRAVDILKKLGKSPDPETKAAAKAALESLAEGDSQSAARRAKEALAPKPKPEEGTPIRPGMPFRIQPGQIQGNIQIRVVGGNGARKVSIKHNNGVKEIEVSEKDREIKISDDPNQGIEMEVTETKNGKKETKKYKAKDADELKKKHPEAHKIYEKYSKGGAGGMIQIQGIQLQPGMMPKPFRIPMRPMLPGQPKKEDGTPEKDDSRKNLEEATKLLREVAEQIKKDSSSTDADVNKKVKQAIEQLNEANKQLEENLKKAQK